MRWDVAGPWLRETLGDEILDVVQGQPLGGEVDQELLGFDVADFSHGV